MEVMKAGEIAAALQGRLKHSSVEPDITGVSIDSRSIKPGDMFIALRGENFDGHDFIASAVEKGAGLVITEKEPEQEVPYILVGDSLKALQDIAGYYRRKFNIPFVAITGSSGKTTTKDMVASVLSQKYEVLKTEGNLNNAIGLPLMLLRLERRHQIAVLEMGMNSPGEIELLSNIVRQDISVISNVGIAHIEKLGSRENILKAKLEIFTYFGEGNIAVINGDNDMLAGLQSDRYKIVRYGLEPENDIQAIHINEKGESGIDFTVAMDGSSEVFNVPLPGIHNVYNALSAITVARLFDLEAESIRRGLTGFKPSKNRMEIITTADGLKIINDVYNANPESMRAAINVLKGYKAEGRRAFIAGDMLELGGISDKEHYEIGAYAASNGIDIIASIGNHSGDIVKGAEALGVDRKNLYAFPDKETAAPQLKQMLRPGDVLLVKGSRAMKLEYIVDYLRERG